nr:probable GTP-binding protein OBGM, mitochondrial [Ipomoea trifida]
MWLNCGKSSFLRNVRKFSQSQLVFQLCSFSDIAQKKTKLAPLQVETVDEVVMLYLNVLQQSGISVVCSITLLSKYQLALGTVIHVVEGKLPSAVKKVSSTTLDPSDIPGTLATDSSECSLQSLPTYETETTFEKTASPCVDNSTSTRLATCALLGSSHTQIPRSRMLSCIQSAGQDSDDAGSGTELEDEPEESENVEYNVAELTEPCQRIVIALGGNGGLEYADEEVASLNAGSLGSEVVLVLELKRIADVGLVGMQNAGKSTLLGALSKAKPTVGHYVFMTLRPNLGNVDYDDFSVTVADIPGLIRGAHENRGLRHAFLRHIERTKVLAYVVDLAAALGDNKGIPPWEQLKDLVLELEHYREGLSDRPSLVVANKIDEDGAEEVCEELKQRVSGVPIFPVCAVLEEGTSELKDSPCERFAPILLQVKVRSADRSAKRDLPAFCRSGDITDSKFKLYATEGKGLLNSRSCGLIFNTFEELDGSILAEIRNVCRNIYAVGPLHAHRRTKLLSFETTSFPSSSPSSLWPEGRS